MTADKISPNQLRMQNFLKVEFVWDTIIWLTLTYWMV